MSLGLIACQVIKATETGERPTSSDAVNEASVAVRASQSALARAFNHGYFAGVIREYDPSITVVAGSQFWDYAGQKRFVSRAMAGKNPGRLKLDIEEVRPLGPGYILARGRSHLISSNGKDQASLFTVVYARNAHGWKIIYAHAS